MTFLFLLPIERKLTFRFSYILTFPKGESVKIENYAVIFLSNKDITIVQFVHEIQRIYYTQGKLLLEHFLI